MVYIKETNISSYGTDDRTRTCTAKPLGPKPSASTNSATSANWNNHVPIIS